MSAVGHIGVDELAAVAVGWTVRLQWLGLSHFSQCCHSIYDCHASTCKMPPFLDSGCSGLTWCGLSALALVGRMTPLAVRLLGLATR